MAVKINEPQDIHGSEN